MEAKSAFIAASDLPDLLEWIVDRMLPDIHTEKDLENWNGAAVYKVVVRKVEGLNFG